MHTWGRRVSGLGVAKRFVSPCNLHLVVCWGVFLAAAGLASSSKVKRWQLTAPVAIVTQDMDFMSLHQPLGSIVAEQSASKICRSGLFYEK